MPMQNSYRHHKAAEFYRAIEVLEEYFSHVLPCHLMLHKICQDVPPERFLLCQIGVNGLNRERAHHMNPLLSGNRVCNLYIKQANRFLVKSHHGINWSQVLRQLELGINHQCLHGTFALLYRAIVQFHNRKLHLLHEELEILRNLLGCFYLKNRQLGHVVT